MAALDATDVTYTLQDKNILDSGLRQYIFKLAFGDGSDTYPSGGVPLTKAKLGCPNVITSFKFIDDNDANGIVHKYDYENNKIRMYISPAVSASTTITDGTAGNAVTMALTNVQGGSAGSSASFDAVNETLILVAGTNKWNVIAEIGVTLS